MSVEEAVSTATDVENQIEIGKEHKDEVPSKIQRLVTTFLYFFDVYHDYFRKRGALIFGWKSYTIII